MQKKTQESSRSRIELDDEMLNRFFQDIYQGEIARLAQDRGLPYSLVYNLVHGRIRSLSTRDYRTLFGEDPPEQTVERVDGEFFRGMVRLWLFLREDMSKADLYKELHPGKRFKKVDYRIFTGEVQTVDREIEALMADKFLAEGLEPSEIREWIEELDRMDEGERVDYSKIKPILDFLEKRLEINPSRILNQWAFRYESGELSTVPKKIYNYALELKERTERVPESGSKFEVERLREDIYGKREGLTLYADIQDELKFLQKYGGKSTKKYLGRSMSHYEKFRLKRVALWRESRIRSDVLRLIREKPEIPLAALPGLYRSSYAGLLVSVLKRIALSRIMNDAGQNLEKRLLTPRPEMMDEYRIKSDVSMDQAAAYLGMSKKAFDVMVAANSDLFRRIGTYDGKKWYLPEQYLKKIHEEKGFSLIKSKYEALVKGGSR